jgi:hypothetical protein
MQADAYRRARKLLSSRRDIVVARVLGLVQSLLIVALLGVRRGFRRPSKTSYRGGSSTESREKTSSIFCSTTPACFR